jgi:phage tail protein X
MTVARYTTVMFDRLDKIVDDRYGDTESGIVEYVLEFNPGLENYGLLLPMGITVFLPDRPEDTKVSTPVIQVLKLW